MPSLSKMVRRLKGKPANPEIGSIEQFFHRGPRPDTGVPPTEIEELFWSNTGPMVHKWHHYLPIYDRYFGPWRSKPLRMLEIGVSNGGSLQMWRKYFGPDAIIFGIDIDPSCAQFDGQSGQVRIGSQADPAFLRDVVSEIGGIDIVLDDGSHDSTHIRQSLDVLYPLLESGGIYMIEDLHAAYWSAFSGGYRAPTSFMTTVKTLVDDIHHWYHDEGQKISATENSLAALHVYDSVVVLEKGRIDPPKHSEIGETRDMG